MTSASGLRAGLLMAAVSLAATAVVGCQSSPDTEASTAAPTCPGAATSDYGLGDAIKSAAPQLAALPHRVATGTATVLNVEGAKAPLRVAITVCGDGLDDDALKDVASTLGTGVAKGPALGEQVGTLTVELQPADKVAQANPFTASRFTSGAAVAGLRGEWTIEAN